MNRYSLGFANKVKELDPSIIGVALALEFIEFGIPVAEVAQEVGVSRQTVYSWFTGVTHPRPHQVEKMEQMLDRAFEEQQH